MRLLRWGDRRDPPFRRPDPAFEAVQSFINGPLFNNPARESDMDSSKIIKIVK
jgi:hypothetical protein